MKIHSIIKFNKIGFTLLSFLFVLGCQTDDSNLQDPKNSNNPDVFIDTFSSGLQYAAFAGTDIFAFQVDNKVTYNNSSASMRFDVPNANDPAGAYAGGAFFTEVGRDLTSYNALTFWAKSSQAATVGVVGFGLDLGENKYQSSLSNLKLSTVWKKYIIPILDPSKLKMEKGLFYISAGPENNNGYTFWVDEVKFENLGTIAHSKASINNGNDVIMNTYIGIPVNVTGNLSTFNMPNGVDQPVAISPSFLKFSSSNEAVATVNALGQVTLLTTGSAVITATFNGEPAKGSITVNSLGAYVHAPRPTRPSASVISIFSDAYTNVPIDFYNGYWQPYQTTTSADFVVDGDNVLGYENFNFVGHQFSNPTQNMVGKNFIHFDIFIPGAIPSNFDFLVSIVDFGGDNLGGGSDNSRQQIFVTKSQVLGKENTWISFDRPFTLTNKGNIGQVIYENINLPNGPGLKTFYLDNVYFY